MYALHDWVGLCIDGRLCLCQAPPSSTHLCTIVMNDGCLFHQYNAFTGGRVVVSVLAALALLIYVVLGFVFFVPASNLTPLYVIIASFHVRAEEPCNP